MAEVSYKVLQVEWSDRYGVQFLNFMPSNAAASPGNKGERNTAKEFGQTMANRGFRSVRLVEVGYDGVRKTLQNFRPVVVKTLHQPEADTKASKEFDSVKVFA